MAKVHASAIHTEQIVEHTAYSDDGDDLDEADRERLHAALDAADASFQRGDGVPIEVVLAKLDALIGP
jgi:hypothetical protein